MNSPQTAKTEIKNINLNKAGMPKKKSTSRDTAWWILRNRLCLNEGAADGDLRPE
jgi:hypothetical protein